MATALDRLLGVPVSRARQREQIDSHLRFRAPGELRATLSESISHITQKSGALLGAQAIFIVVDTYGMDHGWPRVAVLVSILTLIAAALLVMMNLRSILISPSKTAKDAESFERETLYRLGGLAASRGACFNIALYLTFLSVILMGFGAVESAVTA